MVGRWQPLSAPQVIARRNKRLKAMRDRQLRAASTLNRALTEAKSKGLARLSKNAAAHAQQLVRGNGH